MNTPPRRLVCENCGAEFACSRDDVSACWCAKESYRLPSPLPPEIGTFKDCLCPQCLGKLEKRSTARKSASAI
ncbi:MAG: cysteine-rich CWC family protein [Xanthobacteraceae bacterium]